MIDMDVLMDSEQYLKVPQKMLVSSRQLRPIMLYPTLIMLVEYLLIFFIGGFV